MVSVGRRDESCAWSPGDAAVGVVSLPTPGLGVSGASVLLHADTVTAHNPTTNRLLVFIRCCSSTGCTTGRRGYVSRDDPRRLMICEKDSFRATFLPMANYVYKMVNGSLTPLSYNGRQIRWSSSSTG